MSGSVQLEDGKTPTSSRWVIDSRAIEHVCGELSWFSCIQLVEQRKVITEPECTPVETRGVGSVILQTGAGDMPALTGVFYVPGSAYNRISLTKLADSGFTLRFGRAGCKITDGSSGRLVADAKLSSDRDPWVVTYEFNVLVPTNPKDGRSNRRRKKGGVKAGKEEGSEHELSERETWMHGVV